MTSPSVQSVTILFFSISLFLFGCTQNENTTDGDFSSKIDSVNIFIKRSKNEVDSAFDQSAMLSRAFIKAQSISNDSIKCNYYTKISSQLTQPKDSLLFRKVSQAGFQLAEMHQDSICLAHLHKNSGDFFNNSVKLDSAFMHYVKAEKLFTQAKDDLSSGKTLISLARLQNNIGDYTASERTTIQAIKKFKPLNQYEELAFCYKNLADVTKLLNEYERALDYYEEALIYIRKADMGAFQELAHKNNVGLVYKEMGQYTKAVSYFSEVVAFDSLRYKSPRGYGRALNNLGQSYLKLNKTEQLPQLFESAIKVQKSINDISGLASSNYSAAQYYLSIKDTVNCLIYLNKSKNLAHQASNNKRQLKILNLFTKVDPINAANYHQEYTNLSESLQSEERNLRGKFERIQFETEEVLAENQLLARQRQLWTGIAAAILLLALSGFVIFTQRSKNQKLRFEKAQQETNQEIMNLMLVQSEKVEEGKKKEQKRISEELHDGVQGRLQGSRMMLLGLNTRTDEEAINQRKKAIVQLKDIQEEVRAISHELSHAAYQKIHNFILSIQELIDSQEKATSLKINLNYHNQFDWDMLSSDIKINLYRIIQESIQNAIKHGVCTVIAISLNVDENSIKATITDNGKGFKVKKGKKGIGMRNIASRIKKLNGSFSIDSQLGKGTIVSLIIPFENKNTSKNLQKV